MNKIELRPYTLKELAAFYKVDPKTLNRWIKPILDEIGPRHGRYFTIPQVKIIFNKLGVRDYVDPNKFNNE